MSKKRVVIVGGVAGGASCAARLRRMDEDAEIFVYERSGHVSFANCGLPYYLGGVIPHRRKLLVATPERFRDVFRVEVRVRHEVTAIDRENRSVTVRNIRSGAETSQEYDYLVLTPGAQPIRPKVPGVDLPGVFTLRSLEDADHIRRFIEEQGVSEAVVVGGGYVGLEMVENLAHRDIGVTILEAADQLMAPLDPEMVAPVYTELESRDVVCRLSDPLAAIEENGNGLTVRSQKGERIPADLVILAVGVKPEVDLAANAGLEIGSLGGIRVDPQMRTTRDERIFAVGDAVEVDHIVTGKPMLLPLAGPATRQGRVAADVIAGRDAHFRGAVGTAVVGLFGWTLAVTGVNEKTLRRQGIAYQKSYTYSPSHATYYPGAAPIALKLLFSPEDGRVLGAQAVGKDGVDKRIDVIATAILSGDATVFDLEELELCYAPQYGSSRDPVNIAGFVAGNILRGDVDVVHWEDLPETAADRQPLIVDVRTTAEYSTGCLPDAINIPLGELRDRIDELPKDRPIWVHCGVGQRSYYAVRVLRQRGFDVRNLSGGYRMLQAEKQSQAIE